MDRVFFTQKCRLGTPENLVPFLFSQRDRSWYYILSGEVEDTDHLPKVDKSRYTFFGFISWNDRVDIRNLALNNYINIVIVLYDSR